VAQRTQQRELRTDLIKQVAADRELHENIHAGDESFVLPEFDNQLVVECKNMFVLEKGLHANLFLELLALCRSGLCR